MLLDFQLNTAETLNKRCESNFTAYAYYRENEL